MRVTAPINFTFSDDSAFLKKNLGEGHKFSEFACLLLVHCFTVDDIDIWYIIRNQNVQTN